MVRISVVAVTVALASQACWGPPETGVLTEDHRTKINTATAIAEADITTAGRLLKEGRAVDALLVLIGRIKTLQTLLYDEYILKSRAYDAADLPTAKVYGGLIVDLRQAEAALVKWLNEPLDIILNQILLDHPDPRKREEALDAINSGANEIFIQFKTGYRLEIVRSLKVRVLSEPNVAVRIKMRTVLSKLDIGSPGTSRESASR